MSAGGGGLLVRGAAARQLQVTPGADEAQFARAAGIVERIARYLEEVERAPVLSRAQRQTRITICLSNQRQLMLAWLMFASEHKGHLPGNWVDYEPLVALLIDALRVDSSGRMEAVRRAAAMIPRIDSTSGPPSSNSWHAAALSVSASSSAGPSSRFRYQT